MILTINGRAEFVDQDAAPNQKLHEPAERLRTIGAVQEVLASMQRGEGRSADEAFRSLERLLRARASER